MDLNIGEFMESLFIVMAVDRHKGAAFSWYEDMHTNVFHWNLQRLL